MASAAKLAVEKVKAHVQHFCFGRLYPARLSGRLHFVRRFALGHLKKLLIRRL